MTRCAQVPTGPAGLGSVAVETVHTDTDTVVRSSLPESSVFCLLLTIQYIQPLRLIRTFHAATGRAETLSLRAM
ncbi:hypothetical protein GMOD_00006393 [Pyrenophora seminiperda CCB06]|uniref:Uncharacterized protein n=1 Tax=Pyrenophora seminiperda CCB06 TaxID=1302712 RepID=A0A3M7M4Z7_9PLEO|nr:hypothetical protein GMOD_00006393 [Pyrenophora seminiperda CCB06]